jgi:hypothetical protein
VLNFFSKLFCFRTFDKSSFPFFDKLFVFFWLNFIKHFYQNLMPNFFFKTFLFRNFW